MKTPVFTFMLMMLLQLNVLVQAGGVSCAHNVSVDSQTTQVHHGNDNITHVMQEASSHGSHHLNSVSTDHNMSHEMDCCQDECQCDIIGCHVNFAGAVNSKLSSTAHLIATPFASYLFDAPQEYLSFLFKPPIYS